MASRGYSRHQDKSSFSEKKDKPFFGHRETTHDNTYSIRTKPNVEGAKEAEEQNINGSESQKDSPQSVIQNLGKGNAMEENTRSKMETAFGTNFSNVKIHTDSNAANLSRNMNARAFTVGDHIAFGSNEHQPGSLEGDALIAHELAHVVQQSNSTTGDVQMKSDVEYGSLEKDADRSSGDALISIYGKSATVKKNRPAMKSGIGIQRCATTQKAQVTGKQPSTAEELAHARFRSETLAARDSDLALSGNLLAGVGRWAASEQVKQDRKNIAGVEGIGSSQLGDAKRGTEILKRIGPTFNAKGLGNVRTKLTEASGILKAAKKYIGSEEYKSTLTYEIMKADKSLDGSLSELEKLSDSIDGYPFYIEIQKAQTVLGGIQAGTIDPYDGIEDVLKIIKAIYPLFTSLEDKYRNYPAAIGRIVFVVQNFIAINSPSFAGAPPLEDYKMYKDSLRSGLSLDFQEVFGKEDDPENPDFELFNTYANMLESQLALRTEMAKAGTPGSMVPTQTEITAYFKSLSKKSLQEAIDAYESYTSGFFYHRIVTTLDDMNVHGVDELYKRKLSITGSRPLVCSGYAILGNYLMGLAGSTPIAFINAVRATDQNLIDNKIDEGHSIAKMKKGGKTFFVSNDIIVFKEEDAIGPDAVAWENSTAPLIKASGSTQETSLSRLTDIVQDKRDRLTHKRK